MTRQTMIEVRRHIRAIDLALKKEIDCDPIDPRLKPGLVSEWCGHPICNRLKPCEAHELGIVGAPK